MEIFRAYDIRGEYPKDINDKKAYKIARVLASQFNAKKAVIGRDISLATPKIHDSLIKGFLIKYKLYVISINCKIQFHYVSNCTF